MHIGELARRAQVTVKAVHCVGSLAVYRDAITDLDRMIEALSARRDILQSRLDAGAGRTFPKQNATADSRLCPEGSRFPRTTGRPTIRQDCRCQDWNCRPATAVRLGSTAWAQAGP